MPLITVEISTGLTFEEKSLIAQDITRAIATNTSYDAAKVLIFFRDIPRWEQASGGVMRATPPDRAVDSAAPAPLPRGDRQNE